VIDRQGTESDELAQAVEAADRAGAIVTDHVRSIIDAAQSRAAEIEQSARQEAEDVRRQAHASAVRLLERIDSMEGQLGNLVNSLRQEADQLAADLDRRS
jgi:vacuolar-type H+-ATPase subunit E/Vma4